MKKKLICLIATASTASGFVGSGDSCNSSCRARQNYGSRTRYNVGGQQAAKEMLEIEGDMKDLSYENKWVCNGVISKEMSLNQAVSSLSGVPLDKANELIELGAVWALNHYDEDDYEAPADDRYVRLMKATMVEEGVQLRVYPNARRFTEECNCLDESRLLYEDTTFIVVDKPPMIPSQPDSSNYQECVPGCVNQNLGPFVDIDDEPVARPLLCHRVDLCVGGCIVLSKDRNGQNVFTTLQRERKVKKLYKAVTTKPVPLGQHMHWMLAAGVARGENAGPSCQILSHNPEGKKKNKSWIRCVLEVAKCEPIEISDAAKAAGYDDGGQQHYQSTIRLVTGRKHQVRSQLASLGCPIIRDTLYQPIAGLTFDTLTFGEDAEKALDDAIGFSRIPQEPIGLQAHAILFGGVKAVARTPWWSAEE